MVFWLLAVAAPRAGRRWLIATALGICVVVEFGQLIQPEWLRSVRSTTVGHLVLGNDFDARDLLAYGAGIATAALLSHFVRPRVQHRLT
jgi:hypothetical protein